MLGQGQSPACSFGKLILYFCSMLKMFRAHIELNFPSFFKAKILIGCSGGLDSMVLVKLCQTLDLNISLAHCNFCLRGSESEADQAFVEAYGKNNNIQVFTKAFKTKLFIENSRQSVQMAARELRYNWFQTLVKTQQFDCILTAHHSDDNLETFFINLGRGSGLDGLLGIPKQNGAVARPLLPFSKDQLLQYANQSKVQWREDSSNDKLEYQRNQLRHQLLPVLKQIYPNALKSIASTQSNFRALKSILDSHVKAVEQALITKADENETHYNISVLKSLESTQSYLYPLFNRFGFSDWNEIDKLLNAQSGKMILSKTHSLLKDRKVLILSRNDIKPSETYRIKAVNEEIFVKTICSYLKIKKAETIDEMDSNTIYVDFEKLKFPLELRPWKSGDYFYPSGMRGKKKLSKFFKDEKLPLTEKRKVLLLCSNSKVVWVVGKRQDARFMAQQNTGSLFYKISLNHAKD